MYGPFSPTGAKGVSTEFTQAADRANIASGESIETILGKMAKWYTDLKPVAWDGVESSDNFLFKPEVNDRLSRCFTNSEKMGICRRFGPLAVFGFQTKVQRIANSSNSASPEIAVLSGFTLSNAYLFGLLAYMPSNPTNYNKNPTDMRKIKCWPMINLARSAMTVLINSSGETLTENLLSDGYYFGQGVILYR